jgi:hypothetical protein
MKLKVFGGLTCENGKQVRTIVAATSKKKAAELVGVSLYGFSDFWCETGNDTELETALASPMTVFKSSSCTNNDFKPYN